MSLFVVAEGVDGSGKTTYTRRLADYVNAQWTKEPTEGAYGLLFREAIESGDNDAALHMATADREEHAATIQDMLSDGSDVVCDRYYVSCAVNQGVCDDSSMEILRDQEATFTTPDMWIHVSTTLNTCLLRIHSRGDAGTIDALYVRAKAYETAFDVLTNAGHHVEVVSGEDPPAKTIPIIAQILRRKRQGMKDESLKKACAAILADGVSVESLLNIHAAVARYDVAPIIRGDKTKFVAIDGQYRRLEGVRVDELGYCHVTLEPPPA